MAGKKPRLFKNSPTSKFFPGIDTNPEDVFDFPYLSEDETIDYLAKHGRVMFIIRGLPGTEKYALSSMITKKYSSTIVCSADDYFCQSPDSKLRNPDTLKQSHEFCLRRLKEECENGSHPIVVRNTHVRLWEMRSPLDIAAEYGYTVIVAITMRKFKVNATVLENCNERGLKKPYLQIRLNSWQEYLPLYLGWFLAPDDALFLCSEGKKTLKLLLGNETFCSSINVCSEVEVWQHYKVESQLFCIATFCNSGRIEQMFKFYQSEEIVQAYGRHFKLTIPAVVVTKTHVLAIVSMTQDMKKYMISSGSPATWVEEVVEPLKPFRSQFDWRSGDALDKSYSFEKDFPSHGKTVELQEWHDDVVMKVNLTSIMVLAQVNQKQPHLANAEKFVEDLFSEIISSGGVVKISELSKLDNGTVYYMLPNDAWFVKLTKKIVVSSVFTGLYSS